MKKAKEILDKHIAKQRAVMYKPIQIAEILYKCRIGELTANDIADNIEKYRNTSKRWRDEITLQLINQRSTSSQKFQDNIFEANAMPPSIIAQLAKHNNSSGGVVERYIYQQFWHRQEAIRTLWDFILEKDTQTFKLDEFLDLFRRDKRMKRSIDKAYEIVVYALFNSLVRELKITITIEADKSQTALLNEFDDFAKLVLGIDSKHPSLSMPARLYRAGVSNAADKGLDMWANFGLAIQVKHLTLTEELAEDIVEETTADRVLIVCKDSEKETIEKVYKQLGISSRVQGIVTQSHLIVWYENALRGKFARRLGPTLVESLKHEFQVEFPYSTTFDQFFKKRGYGKIKKSNSIFWAEAN
ncbi:MAG: HaeII family restriction endonuclease [Bacteroidota bacterium]|nr:HaeII family restriction endonuclease [Bacteroidota bacterium]